MISSRKVFFPLVGFFLVANGAATIFQQQLLSWKIDNGVVISANLLLFLLTLLGLLMQVRAARQQNPNAIVRAVMAGTGLKLIGVATALLIYLKQAGASKSVYAVYVSLGLYLVYTWLEVRIFLQLNGKKDGSN
ncbi:MAG: hypothetical protein GXC72_06400 [Chitinophagaceae bacterium]|jgi:hypothetical protein|nr:hypothetical protein [Chitinophagaceae bacterium]